MTLNSSIRAPRLRPGVRRALGDYVFILPQFILYFGLTILPFIIALPILFTDQLSFTDPNPEFIGFSNFTRVFTDFTIAQDYVPALIRTLRFVALNYVMVFVFGLTLALLVFEFGIHSGFFTVVYMPWMISGLAVGYMAEMLFSRTTGTANLLFLQLGILSEPLDIKLPLGTAIILPILVGWRSAGFNMALFLSGLLAIPTETIEASIIDGASYWQRLRHVYFPQMVPSFIIATILALIGSFGVFAELVALGGMEVNPEARFLSILFYNYAFQSNRLALGLTLAVETFVPLVVVAILLQRLQKRWQY